MCKCDLLHLQYWYQAVVKGIVPWCFAIHEWCIAYDVRACSAMCVSWYIHWLWLCSPSLKSVHNSESKIRYVNNSCWKYSLISPALTAGANNCIFGDSVLTNSCKKTSITSHLPLGVIVSGFWIGSRLIHILHSWFQIAMLRDSCGLRRTLDIWR